MEVDLGWNEFKSLLGKGLKALRLVGVSDENAEDFAYHMGEFLNRHIDPSNREQRLLKELWDEGTTNERKMLGSMIARLVERDTMERKKTPDGPIKATGDRKKP